MTFFKMSWNISPKAQDTEMWKVLAHWSDQSTIAISQFTETT